MPESLLIVQSLEISLHWACNKNPYDISFIMIQRLFWMVLKRVSKSIIEINLKIIIRIETIVVHIVIILLCIEKKPYSSNYLFDVNK